MAQVTSGQHRGWRWDEVNNRLDIVINGTEIGYFDDGTADLTLNTNGLIVTAGHITATAGDVRITAANARLGAVSAFGTTQPTSWVVCKSGTAPSGAVTTSSGVGANDTVLRKVIADGTVSNVG